VRELYNLVQRAFVLSEGHVITHPHVHQPASPEIDAGASQTIRVRIGESLARSSSA
jgi:DNA-binding NtrC family response regulator